MASVKVGSPFTIVLDTKVNLSTASNPKIQYKKPDGVVGSINGTIENTLIRAKIPGSVNDMIGGWAFEASCRFSGDDTDTVGDTFYLTVINRYDR